MCPTWIKPFLLAFALSWLGSHPTRALPLNCFDFDKKLKSIEADYENRAGGYIVLREGEFAYAFIFTRDRSGLDRGLYWAFLEKGPTPFVACLEGEGRAVTPLTSLHEARPAERFGMTGAGVSRCSKPGLGGVPLRMSASIELGPSIIFHFGEAKGHTYTLLMGAADRWIILRENEERISCYFDQGGGLIPLMPDRR